MRYSEISSANNHAVRSDHLAVWAGVRHSVVCLWGGPILKVGHTPTSLEQVSSELLVSYGCVLTPCLFFPFERCKFIHVAQTSRECAPKARCESEIHSFGCEGRRKMMLGVCSSNFPSDCFLGLVLLLFGKEEVICVFICHDLVFI